jgi:hypothetical protein
MTNVTVNELSYGNEKTKPRFSLSYGSFGTDAEQRTKSISIIRALSASSPFIVEVQSELLAVSPNLREPIIIDFISALKRAKLKFNHSKMLTERYGSILLRLFSIGGSNKITAHKITCLFPKNSCDNEKLMQSLPLNGVKYYFLRKKVNPSAFIKSLNQSDPDDAEIARYTRITTFDCARHGMAGIFHCEETLEGLRAIFTKTVK